MADRPPLNGAVVLVTGAARGIGEATARHAAAAGARVALLGLEPARLATVLDAPHRSYECDVTSQSALDAAVAATIADFGRIDVVVANAGIANNGTVAVNPADALARTVEVNLIGVMRTVSATLPFLIESRGYCLMVSSAAAFTVLPGMAAYCASKAGVEQFGNALRLEVAHRGVAVGTAHPGWIDTDLVRDVSTELDAFRQLLPRLPWPLSKTSTVDECASALVDAIRRRRRRVYVPRGLALVQALRTVTTGRIGEALIRRQAAQTVPVLEEQVRALGRSFGRTSMGNRDIAAS